MSEPAIQAVDLRKAFAGAPAVDGIAFAVAPGECFGFLGANGAGKTTTMRMLYGRIRRDGGRLAVLGRDPGRAAAAVRGRIGLVAQSETLDPELTVRENLTVHAAYFGLGGRAVAGRADALLELMALDHRREARVQDLSGGQRQRLLIARALVNEPELLILDEPTTGLDPQARQLVWDRLSKLRTAGVTMVLTTHYLEEAQRLCDRLVVMDRGRILEDGPPRTLVERHAGPSVLEVPLGSAESLPELGPGARVRRLVRTHDRILLFTDDPERTRAHLGPSLAAAAQLRPATLDDAYLHLVGHGMGAD